MPELSIVVSAVDNFTGTFRSVLGMLDQAQNAAIRLENAQLRVENAQDRVAQTAQGVTEAENEAAEAHDRVAAASEALSAAQSNLDAVRASGTATSKETASAEKDVEKARRELETATKQAAAADREIETSKEAATRAARALEISMNNLAKTQDQIQVQAVMTGLSLVQGLVPGLTAATGAMTTGASAAGLMGGAIGALGGPIGIAMIAIQVFALAWSQNWGGIRDKVQGVVDWFDTNVLPGLQAVWSAITAGVAALQAAWGAAWSAISSAVGAAVGIIQGFIAALVSAVQGLIKWIGDAITAFLRLLGLKAETAHEAPATGAATPGGTVPTQGAAMGLIPGTQAVVPAQYGFAGWVREPTLFLAHPNEYVSITPSPTAPGINIAVSLSFYGGDVEEMRRQIRSVVEDEVIEPIKRSYGRLPMER